MDMVEIFATDGTEEGRLLVAQLLRAGRPVKWIVRWAPAFAGQPVRHFANQHAAAAWVRSVLTDLQA